MGIIGNKTLAVALTWLLVLLTPLSGSLQRVCRCPDGSLHLLDPLGLHARALGCRCGSPVCVSSVGCGKRCCCACRARRMSTSKRMGGDKALVNPGCVRSLAESILFGDLVKKSIDSDPFRAAGLPVFACLAALPVQPLTGVPAHVERASAQPKDILARFCRLLI
jgi:hypothetical protein